MTFSKKQGMNRFIIGILIVLLIISGVINWSYFKEKEEQRNRFRSFLNHYYFAVHESLTTIDRILESEQSSKEEINRQLIVLSGHLNRFDYISSSTAAYVNAYTSGITLFRVAASDILWGNVHNGVRIPPFIEGNQLTEGEKAYLTEIKKHLDFIHEQLYSEETGQENHHLSRHEFNKIGNYVASIANQHYGLLEIYLGN